MKINHYLDRSWFNGLRYTLHIMKIIIILLVLSIGNSFSMTYSQNTLLSLDINKQSIKEVIGIIEKKSEYVFFFSDNVRQDLEKSVDIKVNSKTLDVILNNLFADTDLVYTINDRQVSIAKSKKAGSSYPAPQQQTKTITGTIVDNTKEPLIGVNIVVKGTSTGTVTDIDGKFSLPITETNAVLVISYIGYKSQEIKVGNQSSLNVTLEAETLGLEEIVVVGYGTVKKKDLTGSVSSVNSETISKSPVTSATQAIQGRLPGVFISNSTTKPGENASVVIRGKRSISGSSDPLYIVDGIPVVGGINEISPSDIETIDILKDASATAIYGARGSNGVILITTKRGKAGKTQVDYNGYVGFQTVLNLLEYMDGAAYAETVRESYRSTGKYLSDKPSWEEDQKIGSFANDPYTLESLKMAYDENGNYDPSKVRSGSKWWEAVQRTGMVTDHQLSVRGGNDKTNFTFSGSYYDYKGLVKDEEFSRYSIRLNLEHSVNKYIKLGAFTGYTHSVQERGSTLFNSWRVMPMGRFYDDNGDLLEKVSGTDDQWRNPLLRLAEGAVSNPLKINRFIGSYYADITLPLKGLRFRTNLGIDYETRQDYNFQSAEARGNTMNYARNGTENRSMFTWENLLFYDRTFEDHTIGVTLLQSINEYLREYNKIPVQGTPADELLYYDVGSASNPEKTESGKSQWKLASFMARLNYSFKGKYLATISARYDGSSRLAEGHQWVAFPAAALAWRINEESFMQNVHFLSNLKLRVGYGVVASSEVDPYETKGTLSQKPYNYGSESIFGYAPDKMPNTMLTWETTGQWNAGFDFGFLGNRLNGTIDVYLQNTKDLLLDRQLPIVSGFNQIKSNVGKTRNKGLELTLNSLNINNKNFTWSTDLMMYTNKEEIVELYNGKEDDPGSSWFIGEAINVFYDYKKIGIWQDTPEDRAEMEKFNQNGSNFAPGTIRLWDNGDYKITSEDRVIQGQQRPKVILSLNNTFRYRDFDFSFFFEGNFGAMIKNNISYLNQAHRNGNVKVDYWTPTNPTNAFPRPIEGVDYLPYYETLHYEKSDFIKLRNVTLGYTIPSHITKKWDISRCRVYVQAQNSWMWTNFTGVDPESALNKDVDGTYAGYTRPTPSTWLVGLNISF